MPAARTGSPLPHLRRDWARPFHIGTGTGRRILAPLFFLVFITVATFMMLSLFVGVITTSMGQAAVKQHKAMRTQLQIKKLQVSSPLLWKRLGS